jgi:GAF domain
MSKRGLGVLLVLSFAVAVASIVQDVRFDLRSTQQQSSADSIERTIGSIDLSTANLRAAQAGYVAVGQGPDFWMKRAAELLSEIEIGISGLQTSTVSAEARTHYDAALAALTALGAKDKKARSAIAGGERLQASDLVFMESIEPAARLDAELEAARDAEAANDAAQLAGLRRSRLATNAAALALVLGVGAIILQRVRVPAAVPVPVPKPALTPIAAAPIAPSAPVRPPVQELTFRDMWPAHTVNLREAAEVCVDLARVLDGRDVQPLLERAAKVLDAKGLILWVLESDGVLLRPSLAYGYSDKVLQRLGSLEIAADNPTSLAFRSMQAQTIPSPAVGSTGAIAVPVITPGGCIGVLAAEVKKSTPSDDTLSVARMFAAQLATFIGPAASADAQAAQA